MIVLFQIAGLILMLSVAFGFVSASWTVTALCLMLLPFLTVAVLIIGAALLALLGMVFMVIADVIEAISDRNR